ncbi:MAG: S8 family serine peptidase [bacterium]|nr:S8 family serine peptidase [bacterium]
MAATKIYTYRNGKKVYLRKREDEFVVRALPEELGTLGLPTGEQVSSASSRITCTKADLENIMTTARAGTVAHHGYELSDSGDEFLITDRVYVVFATGTPTSEIDATAGKYGLFTYEQFSQYEYVFQLTNHTGMNPVKLVVQLNEKEACVELAENDLNYRVKRMEMLHIPADEYYLKQWHLHNRSLDPDFDCRASSRCETAWQLLGNYGSPDVVIAITDDGCLLNHPDFNSQGKFADWGYFIKNNLITKASGADPVNMYQSGNNHGTSCAGVAAAELDGKMTVGAAPGCRLLPIKWVISGPYLLIGDTRERRALDYLADKVDIISNSWGRGPHGGTGSMTLTKIRQLQTTGGRRNKGIVFLWAAGNENCPISHSSSVEIPYTNGIEVENGVLYWVGVETSKTFSNNRVGEPNIMHVAALASTAQRSHYSNYGTGIDICAPSSNSHEYHRMTVKGLGIVTTTGETPHIRLNFGGTSSAAPLAAGVAALVVSANPKLDALEVIEILKKKACKNLNMTGYPKTAPANFDLNTSWDVSPIPPFDKGDFNGINSPFGTWSPWFGHGKVDAAAAVQEALDRT